jgi:hypothetical protein
MNIMLVGWDGAPVPSFLADACARAGIGTRRADEVAAAIAIADGHQPSAAVADWSASAAALLRLVGENDPRLVPVNLRAAGNRPSDLLGRLADRLGCSFAATGKIPARQAADLSGEEALIDILARDALDGSAAARDQAAALAAAGLIAAGPEAADPAMTDRAGTFLHMTRRATVAGGRDTAEVRNRLAETHKALEALRADMTRARATLATVAGSRPELGRLSGDPQPILRRLQELETTLQTARAELSAGSGHRRMLETRLLDTGARLAAAEIDLARIRGRKPV